MRRSIGLLAGLSLAVILIAAAPLYQPTLPGAQAAQTQEQSKAQKWTCPMHPHYIAEEFGQCPICGMDLVKLDTGADAAPGPATGSEPARTAITIAPETLQTTGVRLAKAEKSSFGRIIRSYGIVADNERLQTELTARLEGWIEELKIRAVGDEVKDGDLLFTIYAPEFVVSQRDYLDALNGRDRTRIEAVKTRLRAFGMQERAVDELVKKGSALEFVPYFADRDGTVAMIDLRPGSYVKRGTMLTRIQDYSQVWVMVSVPEKDLGFISVGTPARITFPNLPGREVLAKVEYVYPVVDAKTRTGRVRLVLDNPDGQLRPGAYADVAFEVAAEQRLAVPSEAILMSGGGRYVVASLGKGRFEPRVVTTGLTSGRWTEVSGEIQEGEEIVVSGQFLIDSESALRESFRKLERLQLPLSVLKLTDSQFAMVDHLVDAALYIHEALTDGYQIEPKFLDPAISVKTMLWPTFQHTKMAFVMQDAVTALEHAKAARTTTELQSALAALVTALKPWLVDGAPTHYEQKKLALFKDTASGRHWVQMAGKPNSPFAGKDAELVPWPAAPAGADAAPSVTSEAATPSPAPPLGGHQH
ncbi:MAG: efflux RND transporter periplasmic adaptor subunit [Hyphomicrobiaceae bacterium]|nr:efflux RND transporter periplasmic adaptor subunit [Hyphomicrobiaceae bacterium]